jgi:hypothetical protein
MPSMREYCVDWDIFADVIGKDELAVGFALHEAHREALGRGSEMFSGKRYSYESFSISVRSYS